MEVPAQRDYPGPGPDHWDNAYWSWQRSGSRTLWRRHSDAVNAALFSRWMPPEPVQSILKTDLFDEATTGGLYPLLQTRASAIHGIDVSASIVSAAMEQAPGLQGRVADVRKLPYPDKAFDVVVSNSTLDHFETRQEMMTALQELWRVLRVGGTLLITLDNLANPLVAMRNLLPFHLLNRFGLVPYYPGASCRLQGLQQILQAARFAVVETDTVMHCQRVLSVALAGLIEKYRSPPAQRRYLHCLMKFERLSRWPTRFLTGHFVAARAVKVADAQLA